MAESIIAFTDEEDQNQLEGTTVARILPVSATPMQRSLNRSYNKQLNLEESKVGTSTKLVHRLGFDELFSSQVWRASVAELLGTAVLVFMLDTVVISSLESDTKTPNVLIACFVALLITILLLATAPISGGHINPAISLSAALVGLVSFSRAIIYIVAQCIGAILGSLALKAVLSNAISSQFSLGGCTLNVVVKGHNGPTTIGIGLSQGLWLEIFCTFVFLFPVSIAFDHRQVRALGPVVVCSIIGIVIGLLVYVSTTVTKAQGYAGAGINPARCIGPAIVRGGHLWTDHWVFWVGPFVACIVFYLYFLIIPREHFKPRVIKQ